MQTTRPQTVVRRRLRASLIVYGTALCWLVAACAVFTPSAAAQSCASFNNEWSVGPTRPCQNLQQVLDAAQPGDTIKLDAGATFVGPITLPAKTSTSNPDLDWITIRTSADANLPPPGQRVNPSYASFMPKIVSQGFNQPAIQTARRAQRYRFVGVEVTMTPVDALTSDYELVTLVLLGDGAETDLADAAHHLVFDRSYIHGQPNSNLRRCVALNSEYTDITNSYISDCHVIGREAQAIGGWNGRGPFSIVNNYLEGAGENIMFGGAISSYLNPDGSKYPMVPSDIVIRRNHFHKPPAWRNGPYHWAVKNLLELKNASRVVIDGNVFEYSWLDGQVGYAILFTVRGEEGVMPWATVQDVEFTNNVVRHAASGIQILGNDYQGASQLSKRIAVRNNVFEDINGPVWCGANCSSGHFLVISNSADRVAIDHNTIFHTGNITSAAPLPMTRFLFNNNLLAHNDFGVMGDSAQPGLGDPNHPGIGALDMYFPGYDFRRNLVAGANPARYPANNFYPASIDDALFVNRAGGNYRLASNSPYKNAGTDGRDVGADIDALEAALARPNGIEDARFFVGQQYMDFLNRAPIDPEDGQAGQSNLLGWDFWTGEITQCGANSVCLATKRRDVSKAFFYSGEFIQNNPALAESNRGNDSYNREFVRQCYYRYLRRRCDPAVCDPGGFNFWVGNLNSSYPIHGNGAYDEIISAFLASAEYRARFGQP
jgi:hypothetical protein